MFRWAGKQLNEAAAKFRAWARENPWRFFLLAAALVAFLWVLIQTIRAGNMGLRAKTFWDWLELLIVPAVLAAGAWWLNRGERQAKREAAEKRAQTEREIALDRQHQTTLEAYFDRMTELLLMGQSKQSEAGTEPESISAGALPISIARARTLAVLRTLDPTRVGAVLRFLGETKAGVKSLSEVVPLAGGNLNRVEWGGADLSRANLDGANLRRANLGGANLRKANLRKADLSGANLRKANLSDANLIGVNLGLADLSNADLKKTDLSRADLRVAHLKEADLSGALLRKADLVNAYLSGANLRKADLRGAYLIGTLSGADLREADLRGAYLMGVTDYLMAATLSGATIRGATLSEANLWNGSLGAANLWGAKYDSHTVWPDGFDPEAAGAALVEGEWDEEE